jgi:amidase
MTTTTLPQALQERCTALRAARDAQLPKSIISKIPNDIRGNPSLLCQTPGLLSSGQLEIINADATTLARAIAIKTYTSVEVIEAFIISACCAQKGTNCLAWLFAEEAIDRARWLDNELERTGKTVGPLHGVPMSVKGEHTVRAYS